MAAVRAMLMAAAAWMCLTAGMRAAPPNIAADEALLKKVNIDATGPDLLDYFRRRTVAEPERQRIVELIRQLGSDAYAIRERASAELVDIGLPAAGLLRQHQTDPDVEIARRCDRCLARIERGVPLPALSAAAARVIAVRKPAGSAEVVLAHLPFADDETVADELRDALAAVAARDGRIEPVVETALGDSAPVRRSAAAEALVRTGLPAGLEAARRALADPVADVRLRTAMAFVTVARDRAAVPKLIELLADLPQSAGWRVEEILIRLAGDGAPTVSLGSEEASRKNCRDVWLAWWSQHGAQIDLARLEGAAPTLGYTLIVTRNRPNTAGSVMEVNAAKDVLWSISGLQMPMDAVVTGKDRVLIVEGNRGDRVSERDTRGNILWSESIQAPVGAQRLANGHTLVFCRNQIVQWDQKRNAVVKHTRSLPDLIAGTQTPDGDFLILTNRGMCIRLDKDGKQIKSFQHQKGPYFAFGGVEGLPDGALLLTQDGAVTEFDREGTQLWTATVPKPTAVQRLPNGNALAAATVGATESFVVELDRAGKTVWEYRFTDGSIPFRARRR